MQIFWKGFRAGEPLVTGFTSIARLAGWRDEELTHTVKTSREGSADAHAASSAAGSLAPTGHRTDDGSNHDKSREALFVTTTDLRTQSPAHEAGDVPDSAPTTHARLLTWVREVAELTQPDAVHWVDGSQAEYEELTGRLVAAGTFVRLDQEARQLLVRLRPVGRRPRRGPHLHLQPGRGRRRAHQQLDGPRRDARHDDRALPGLDARPHDVRHPVRAWAA